MKVKLITAILLILCAIRIGGLAYENMMWAIWGKQNRWFEYVGFWGCPIMFVSGLIVLKNFAGPNAFEQGHTRFALDVGGVFEYYPHPHGAIRVDIGDTIVRFKSGDFFYQRLDDPLFVQRKLSHNFQLNVGFALRF